MEIFGIGINPMTFLIIGFVIILGITLGIVKCSRYCMRYGLKSESQTFALYFFCFIVWFLYLVSIMASIEGFIQTKDITPGVIITLFTIFVLGFFIVCLFWEVMKHKKGQKVNFGKK